MPCDQIHHPLAAVAGGEARLGRSERRHVETCLHCQAELAQYRRLLRTMGTLSSSTVPLPDGLADDVLHHLELAEEHGAARPVITGRKAAYLGGIAAATAAGAGAAIVLASRGRRIRLPLAG